MQKILGYLRKAVTDYNMISEGDRIAVGVSGGKDSVILAAGLKKLSRFLGVNYEIVAITLDPCFDGVHTDYSTVENYFKELEIEYIIKRTEIAEVIFDVRKENNPCSLCARMRRGALHDAAKAAGCNKIALGHHYDDAVETFVMNLFNEGRVGSFAPVTYMSRKDVTVIRPLIIAEERDIIKVAKAEKIPIVKSSCPVDGHTERQWTKDFLYKLDKEKKGVKKLIFGAMVRGDISGFGIKKDLKEKS